MDDYELYLGDCLKYMKTMPDKSVDAIITDLPYGTTACNWDEIIPFEPMWEQVMRIDRGVFVTTASQPFTSKLVMSNPSWFKYEWIWEKSTGTRFLDAKKRPLLYHENILVFNNGTSNYNPQMWKGKKNHQSGKGPKNTQVYRKLKRTPTDISGIKYPRSVLKFINVNSINTEHPTQKPVELYEYLINTYTNPNDTVLDFVMGSGTTGVACMQLGRKFIGCEIDEGYYKIAEKRIKQAAAQILLPIEMR